MVADGDEYDDGTSVEPGSFNAFMTTAAVDLTGVVADSVVVELDSSFRQWDAQTGRIDASFDGGTSWDTLLTLTTANSGADLSRVNEHLSLPVENPSGGTLMLRFAYLNAGNDWWWALDNVRVEAVPDERLRLVVDRDSGRIAPRVRMLCSRSASLIMMTRRSLAMARNILRKFSACASNLELN